MSLVVVLALIAGVFLYFKAMRSARQAWLVKLDLPGRWRSQPKDAADEEELMLQGSLDHGEFVQTQAQGTWRGEWRLEGHILHLRGAGRSQALDLHYFKPGSIGLEHAQRAGSRQLYTKMSTNVVPLRAKTER